MLHKKLSKNIAQIIDNVNDFITIKTSISNINDYFPNSKIYKGFKVDNQMLYYQHEILVELKRNQSVNQIKSKLPANCISKVINEKYFVRIFIAESYDALDIANKIQETDLVVFSHPNFYAPAELHQVPNDTYFQNQYYLNNTGQVFNTVENHSGTSGADIRALGAWGITQGSNNIVVAVIDQGVTNNHPDLPNTRQLRLNDSNFIAGQNVNDPSPDGNGNHGNACAGIIAAEMNNNQGITGFAPNVRIMAIKVFSDGGSADEAGFANAIDFFAAVGSA